MKKISFLIIVFLLLILPFKTAKAEEKKGYIQFTAVVEDALKENKASIKLVVSKGYDGAEPIVTYLLYMNKYTTILTLPEGDYVLETATVEGDELGDYNFICNNPCFTIKKDKPVRLYIGIGDVVLDKHSTNDISQEEQEKIDEEENKKMQEILDKVGLDFYDEDGNIKEDVIAEEYKKDTGNDISDIITAEEKLEKEKEKELKKEKEREEEDKKFDAKMNIIKKAIPIIVITVVIIFIIMAIIFFVIAKRRNKEM